MNHQGAPKGIGFFFFFFLKARQTFGHVARVVES
jgi:hypothetical protein